MAGILSLWPRTASEGRSDQLGQKPGSPPLPSNGWRWVRPVLLLVVAAWLAAFALYTADYFLDDAFIGFRYVENVLAGEGFVFNTGTRVEGVTNIGWLMVLLPLASILGPPQAAKILGLATVILTLFLAVRVATAYRSGARTRSEFLAVAPALLVVSSVDFLYFPLSGMETGLAAALTLLGTWVLLRRPRSLMTAAVVAWMLFLVRPEFGVAYPLFVGALLAFRTARWGQVAAPSAVWTVLVSVSGLARYLYFGVLLPNTFLAKSASLSELPDNFLASLSSDHLNLPPPFSGLPALLVVAFGVVVLWRRHAQGTAFAGSIVASSWLFALYANEDWTELGRYFAPALPLAFLFFWAGLSGIVTRFEGVLSGRRMLQPVLALALVLLVLAGGRRTVFVLSPDRISEYPGYVLTSRQLIEPARWMDRMLPPDAVIATRRIGAVGYYSGREIFDYKFGLTEPEVARRISESGQRFDNPRIEPLRDIWQRRAPDYLLEDASLIEGLVRPGESVDGFEIHGIVYGLERRFPLGTRDEYWMLCRRLP